MTQPSTNDDQAMEALAEHPYVLRYAMPRSGTTEMAFGSLGEVAEYLRGKPGVVQKAAGTIEVLHRLDISHLLAELG
jgi:hypothetical protein